MAVALGRARFGATATFGLAGAMCAVWTVRIPALSDKLHLDPAALGTAALCFGVGAMLTMRSGGRLIARIGSRRTLIVAAPASSALPAAVGWAPTYTWLLVTVSAWGTVFGLLDAGMNAQAAVLERVAGRHLMNGAHAGWSIGSVAGGGLGALTALAHWTFTSAMIAAGAVCVPVAVSLIFTYYRDPPDAAPGTGRTRIPRVVYVIGAVTCASFVVEGAVADWSGLYLRNELSARESVAAVGYPCFELAMIIGRTFGDRIRRRVGSRAMLTAAGLGVVAAFTVVVSAPRWWVALGGFFLTGLAVCTVVPLTFSIAGALDPSGAGVAQAGAMGYAGMLVGPVAVGYLANATSLRTGLTLALALGAAIALLGRRLPTGPALAELSPGEEVKLGERA